MVATKLKTNLSDIDSILSVAAIGAAAESIATAGGTVPADAGELHCYPAAAMHWSPPGGLTPTATTGHAVAANEMFVLSHENQTALIFEDTGSDMILLIAFKHGSGRQDIRT